MKTDEIMDPLTRIQEEIKEVVRREEEYHRQLTTLASPDILDITEDINMNKANISLDSQHSSSDTSLTINSLQTIDTLHADNTSKNVAGTENLISIHDDNNASNTPSLASSVNGKESLDGHHSDDSGISASSSPVNGKPNNLKLNISNGSKEHRYIGPNCYNLTPEPPQQKLMTRTVSTPHLAATKPRQFPLTPAHKGVMQRFIASRGKLQFKNGNISNPSNAIMLNSKNTAALMNGHSSPMSSPTTLGTIDFNIRNPTSIVLSSTNVTPALIQRDADGRPKRPGYIPVEVKIQRELKDLKSRESELKKIRKLRNSTADLLNSIDNENIETDEDDSEVEHCYGPGQLRTTKSISELCDANQSSSSISPRTTPSPLFVGKSNLSRNSVDGMRPAMSLAQLCDLDPEEAPSSHRLIAQWENLIQQNA